MWVGALRDVGDVCKAVLISPLFPCRFEFSERLRERLRVPVRDIAVFEDVVMQGDSGAVATIDLPSGATQLMCRTAHYFIS